MPSMSRSKAETASSSGAISGTPNGGSIIAPDVASKALQMFARMAKGNLTIGVDEKQTEDLQDNEWRIKRYSDFSWDCIPMPQGPAGTNSSALSTVLAGISSRTANTTLTWQFLRELTAGEENQSMLFTDSHSVSALRSVTDSDKTRRILRQDTPGESRTGVEILPEVMEQAAAAPRFRNYDQALLLTEGLVQTAMEDEHNLSLQLQRVQHEVQEYLQK